MNRHLHREYSRGFSLFEILVCIAVFSITIALCSKLFLTTSRLSTYSIAAVDRVNEVCEVQRLLLDTIRSASAVADSAGSYQTNDNVLVLKMNGWGEPSRYRVLGMLDGRNRLNLMELVESDSVLQPTKYITCRLPLETLHFNADQSARCVTVGMTLSSPNLRRTQAGAKHRLVAALRAQTVEESLP